MRLTATRRAELRAAIEEDRLTPKELCEAFNISRATLLTVRREAAEAAAAEVDVASSAASSSATEDADDGGQDGSSDGAESDEASSSESPVAFSRPRFDYLAGVAGSLPESETGGGSGSGGDDTPGPSRRTPHPAACIAGGAGAVDDILRLLELERQAGPGPAAATAAPRGSAEGGGAGEPRFDATREAEFLRDKIRAYVENFSYKLSGIAGETPHERERFLAGLAHLPEERLNSLLDAIKYRISQGGCQDFVFTLLHVGCTTAETVAPYAGLRLQGFARSVDSNEAAKECAKEIMCENLSSMVLSPERRLMLILASTAYNVHSLNTTKAATEDVARTAVSHEMAAQFADL